jgi:hypothetical protein
VIGEGSRVNSSGDSWAHTGPAKVAAVVRTIVAAIERVIFAAMPAMLAVARDGSHMPDVTKWSRCLVGGAHNCHTADP